MEKDNFVFDWTDLIEDSLLGENVWRDLLPLGLIELKICVLWDDFFRGATKVLTREGGYIDIAPVGRDGKRQQQAVRYITEGTMLRLLHALCVLYRIFSTKIDKSMTEDTSTSPTKIF